MPLVVVKGWRHHDMILKRYRQASQLVLWLGVLDDQLGGNPERSLTEKDWQKELEMVEKIATIQGL